jgi:hypothetical protein
MIPRRLESRRLTAGVLAGAVTVGLAFALGSSASAGDSDRGTQGAKADELRDITVGEVHPTQAVLGFDEVYYKLGRYRSDKDEAAGDFNKRFEDWCETNGQGAVASVSSGARLDDPGSFKCEVPVGEETDETIAEMKTAVVGPGGELYLTDGHHTLTSFLESPDGGSGMHLRVRITDDLSDLSNAEFWKTMEKKKYVWLRDENNKPIAVDQLPNRLGLDGFDDDKYRSLVYFTRDIGYEVPDDAPEFLEFYWGSWLRKSIDLDKYDLTDRDDYLDAVEKSSKTMAALKDSDVVEEGTTAGELGKIDEWNGGKGPDDGEFAKLSKPMSDDKPGSLSYALDYRKDTARQPVTAGR